MRILDVFPFIIHFVIILIYHKDIIGLSMLINYNFIKINEILHYNNNKFLIILF